MKILFRVGVFLLTLCSPMYVYADIIDQGGTIFQDSERQKSAIIADRERQKNDLRQNTQREIAYYTSSIEKNNRTLNRVLDPRLYQLELELRRLEQLIDVLSYDEYLRKKRGLISQIKNITDNIHRLEEQNVGYEKKISDIRNATDAKIREIDYTASEKQGNATDRGNAKAVESILRELLRNR